MSKSYSYRVWILAGESSGDMYGARLARELRTLLGDRVSIAGMGSARMREAGVDILVDSTELGVVGIVEILGQFGTFLRIFFSLWRRARRERPDLVIPIDYPGFNLRFARAMYWAGIPVCWYISPQVWAWGGWRIPKLARYCRKMLVIFPFETQTYAGTGLDVEHLPPIWPWEVAAPMHDWYLTLTAPDRIEMVFGSMFRWPSWSFWFHGRACTTTKGQWKTEGAFLEDATSLPGAHLLDPETTHAILAEVAPLNRELEGLLLEYIAELEVRLRQKFRAGEIERAPLRLRPEVRRPKFGASLYGVRPSLLGWQIEDTLTRSEAPALSEMLDRIERLKLERSAAVHSLVAARLHPAD